MLRLFPLVIQLSVLALSTASAVIAQPDDVRVLNFPDLQQVEGEVEVTEPVPHARLVTFDDVVVGPADRADVGDLVDAGRLDASGFTGLAVNLHVRLNDTVFGPGEIGVLLVPETAGVLEVVRQEGEILLAQEAQVEIDPESRSRHFTAPQLNLRLGFPRYRLLLFNTGNRSAIVTVYAYLTH